MASTDATRVEHVDRARGIKAARLAQVLEQVGATPELAAGFGPESRQQVAAVAGVHPPSDTSWTLAIGLLADAGADPFVGLP